MEKKTYLFASNAHTGNENGEIDIDDVIDETGYIPFLWCDIDKEWVRGSVDFESYSDNPIVKNREFSILNKESFKLVKLNEYDLSIKFATKKDFGYDEDISYEVNISYFTMESLFVKKATNRSLCGYYKLYKNEPYSLEKITDWCDENLEADEYNEESDDDKDDDDMFNTAYFEVNSHNIAEPLIAYPESFDTFNWSWEKYLCVDNDGNDLIVNVYHD